MRRPAAAVAGAILLASGACLLARAGWVRAKGAVGEILIDRALDATLADGRLRVPWSWADMRPVARLAVARLRIERPILSNASGEALAFGLGHLDGTARPGGAGNCVLAGHRDSWGAFLEDLVPGDTLSVTTSGGRSTFRVVARAVVRFDDGSVLDRGPGDRLTLLTCFPFRGWLHSPFRYVVTCERVGASPSR